MGSPISPGSRHSASASTIARQCVSCRVQVGRQVEVHATEGGRLSVGFPDSGVDNTRFPWRMLAPPLKCACRISTSAPAQLVQTGTFYEGCDAEDKEEFPESRDTIRCRAWAYLTVGRGGASRSDYPLPGQSPWMRMRRNFPSRQGPEGLDVRGLI